MTVRMIWAEASGGVLGASGGIPWRVPGEQLVFRERTMGAVVVMGRATWESLPARARPLPGRRTVVLTRTAGWRPAGAEVCASVEQLLLEHDEFWVAGGGAVYAALLPYAGHVVRTRLDLVVAGDVFAPRLGPQWRLAGRERVRGPGVPYVVEDLVRVFPGPGNL